MADCRIIRIILIRHVVLIALLTAFMDSASASNVTCNPGIANIVLKAGALAVPMNASPGTIISNIPPDIFQMNCRFLNQSAFLTSGVATIHLTLTAPLAPGFSDVYTTGIQGVGIRYIFNSSVCGVTNVVMTNSAVNLVCAIAGPLGGPYVTDNLTVTPVFVVYGPVSGGGSVISTVPVLTQKYETATTILACYGHNPPFIPAAPVVHSWLPPARFKLTIWQLPYQRQQSGRLPQALEQSPGEPHSIYSSIAHQAR